MAKRCKHQYEKVLVHWLDPFWGDELYLGRQCQSCGKIKVDTLPMEGRHFLTPEETLDRYPDHQIVESAEHDAPDLEYGLIDAWGFRYDLWWESINDKYDGYAIRDKDGNFVKSWIAKERE